MELVSEAWLVEPLPLGLLLFVLLLFGRFLFAFALFLALLALALLRGSA